MELEERVAILEKRVAELEKIILNEPQSKVKKKKFGTYGRVKLTENEYEKLCNEFGQEFIEKQIDSMDKYVESNNNKNKYSNFNLVLRRAIRENWFEDTRKPTRVEDIYTII